MAWQYFKVKADMWRLGWKISSENSPKHKRTNKDTIRDDDAGGRGEGGGRGLKNEVLEI